MCGVGASSLTNSAPRCIGWRTVGGLKAPGMTRGRAMCVICCTDYRAHASPDHCSPRSRSRATGYPPLRTRRGCVPAGSHSVSCLVTVRCDVTRCRAPSGAAEQAYPHADHDRSRGPRVRCAQDDFAAIASECVLPRRRPLSGDVRPGRHTVGPGAEPPRTDWQRVPTDRLQTVGARVDVPRTCPVVGRV